MPNNKEKSTPKQSEEKQYLDFAEAQEFLGVSHDNLLNSGIPTHKTGEREVFLRDDLITWMQAHYPRH
jgi:hypothetical protein